MPRVDWIEQRLLNWARWKLVSGRGGLGYTKVNMASEGIHSGYREAVVPISDCEASDTDEAVQLLDGPLKATVIEAYTGAGGRREQLARLCCSQATMDQRIWRAHRVLAEHFTARQDKARLERERVEQVLQWQRAG